MPTSERFRTVPARPSAGWPRGAQFQVGLLTAVLLVGAAGLLFCTNQPAVAPDLASRTPEPRTLAIASALAQYQEQDQIDRQVRDYLDALREAGEWLALRRFAHPSVSDSQLQRAWARLRERRYGLVAVTDFGPPGERKTVSVHLRDRDGALISRVLALQRDGDRWLIVDPESLE
jgi:hypothetical protein